MYVTPLIVALLGCVLALTGAMKYATSTGWYGSPEHATVEKGVQMLDRIADAIAKEARELFRMLEEAEGGGTAEIARLRPVAV